MPSCSDGIRAPLSSSRNRSALGGDLWLSQVFRGAGLAFHAITVISLFATRGNFSRYLFSFDHDSGLDGSKARVVGH